MLNVGKKNACKADLQDLYKHFKSVNSKVHDDENIRIDQMFDVGNVNEILDVDIGEMEIRKAVKQLKTGKSSGIDGILNEYIIHTLELLLPVYKLLFNHVMSKGCIPQDWLIGIVIPVFKKKGSELDPNKTL